MEVIFQRYNIIVDRRIKIADVFHIKSKFQIKYILITEIESAMSHVRESMKDKGNEFFLPWSEVS